MSAEVALSIAVRSLLSAMEMQEGRESGALHISQPNAMAIWREAQAEARRVLAGVAQTSRREKWLHVIVFGGRKFDNRKLLFATLDEIHATRGIALVVHGDCNEHLRWRKPMPAEIGADQLADQWALSNGVHVARFPALWDALGNGAGPLRNVVMPKRVRVDLGVGFPGGKGTADMRRVLKLNSIETLEFSS